MAPSFAEVDVVTAGDNFVCQVCQDIADNGPYELDEAEELIPAHSFCRCAFAPAGKYARDYNPYHEPAGSPEGGQFTSGPGAEIPQSQLDPRVTTVGGDQWNKDLAVKLERQYQGAKPELEKILTDMLPEHRAAEPETDEEEEGPLIPDSWDMLSNADQDAVKEDWMKQTYSEFLDSEQNNWYESGQALDQAKQHVADKWGEKTIEQTLKGPVEHYEIPEWAQDVFDTARGEHRIPFTDEQIYRAIDLTYENDYEGGKDPDISFNDEKLKEPQYGHDPTEELPLGIEKPHPEMLLTQDMRDSLEKGLIKAFNKEADSKSSDEEPPSGYFDEGIGELQDQVFEDMSDKTKFQWAQDNWADFPKGEEKIGETVTLAEIPHWDPIGDRGSDKDYQRTKIAATNMSRERAADLMVKRGVFDNRAQALVAAHKLDDRLWVAWKSSSTSEAGRILQAAAAAELGGRARGELADASIKDTADRRFDGGWSGIRAYLRAKWETTQFLLDKANMPTLDVFRAVSIQGDKGAEYPLTGQFTKLTDIKLERNGAQSTSTKLSVPNNWDGAADRVVLRMHIPRTAALSVPVYGQNVYGEEEVVVTGTAWGKWDAWRGRAPDIDEVPMHDRARIVEHAW
jgi:hypothetical protein